MPDQQYVTLVARGGTPVRISDQSGAPYPTTGAGALVFANHPTITNAVLVNPTIILPRVTQVVDTIEALRDVEIVSEGMQVLGYATPGDGGGGLFYWDAESTATDNGGTIIELNAFETGRAIRVSQNPVNVLWFGATIDGVEDDALAINRAIQSLVPFDGGTVVFPAAEYNLLTEIIVNFDNVTLDIGTGASILQQTYGYSFIQVNFADNVTVKGGGLLYNPITKTEITGPSYRGRQPRIRATGVYVYGSNNCTVRDITVNNSVNGVVVCPSVEEELTARNFNNQVLNVKLVHFDFGVLVWGQQNLQIDGLNGYWTDRSQGSDTDPSDNGPAPHLIYISGAPGRNLTTQNVTVSNCTDFFNAFSSSYKVKDTNGISLTNMVSQLCVRGFDFDANRVSLVAPVVQDLIGQTGIGFSATGSNCVVTSAIVYVTTDLSQYDEWIGDMVIDFDLIRTIVTDSTTSNITFQGGKFSCDHLTTGNDPARIEGTNIKLIDCEFEERGANTRPVSFFPGAVDCKLIRPSVQQASGDGVFRVYAGATGTNVVIDPEVLDFTFSGTSYTDDGTNTTLTLLAGQTSGTWTPVPSFTTPGDFVASNVDANGWYMKQGSWVTIGFRLIFDSNAYTTASGDFTISGVPFSATYPVGGFTYSNGSGQFDNLSGTITDVSIQLSTASAAMFLRRSVAGTTGANLTTANVPASTAGIRVYGQIMYQTTS